MNSTELSEALASKTGLTKAATHEVVVALAETITDELKSGKEVVIHGLGKVEPVYRGARAGKNPATGEAIQIPASVSAKLKVSAPLKRALNP